ncbi:MAG: methylenetetrahydrofolate reductase C-terminal domain-containing protein [Methanomassiliicoccales archaeon]|nr:MAG: methylenetetrahydrofolate reductase C-terminal domain-containing protein [Methanomassiliicoccales archaeon]
MIIGEQKKLKELIDIIEGHREILVVGCRSCVAICLAGGEKEVGVLSEALRLHSDLRSKGWDISEETLERACEKEFVAQLEQAIIGKDCIISLACGVGAQVVQEMYPDIRVVPGLNTSNMGAPEEHGIYLEKCGGCGDCVLHLTGGICPVARCSKSLMNGPCGGSQGGRCEIGPDVPCAWDQIYNSLERLGRPDLMDVPIPPRDWRPSRSGGPRKVVRKEAVLTDEEKRAKGASR